MGADSLDAQLEPLAEFLLVVIVMLAVAAIASYALSKAAQRRKEKAHNKLSASRRGKDTGIDLFGQRPADEDGSRRQRSTGGRASRKGSGFNLLTYLQRLAGRMEGSGSRRRGKRRGRRASSSENLRIDILKKPAAPERDPPTP